MLLSDIYIIYRLGITSCSPHKSFPSARRFRIQDFRARKKTRKPHYIHDVFTYNYVKHIDAAFLLPSRFHKVRNFSRGLLWDQIENHTSRQLK